MECCRVCGGSQVEGRSLEMRLVWGRVLFLTFQNRCRFMVRRSRSSRGVIWSRSLGFWVGTKLRPFERASWW